MHETPEDLAELDRLLEQSYQGAGGHLRAIHTEGRRLRAAQLVARLTGMRLLVLATVSPRGHPLTSPVDGVFYRGHFYFGTDPGSVRWRHLTACPWVSATHLPSEDWAVVVHGRAVPVDTRAKEQAGFRAALLDVYTPRYGPEWEQFLDSGPVYARIEPERMFSLDVTAADSGFSEQYPEN
jgi:nitroimidazol reductase NimA-like FMN-containing flavoprotein (pyridoxamine 5'-phosphate oxidase superfamily)